MAKMYGQYGQPLQVSTMKLSTASVQPTQKQPKVAITSQAQRASISAQPRASLTAAPRQPSAPTPSYPQQPNYPAQTSYAPRPSAPQKPAPPPDPDDERWKEIMDLCRACKENSKCKACDMTDGSCLECPDENQNNRLPFSEVSFAEQILREQQGASMSGKKMYGQYGQPIVRRASFTAATARPTVSIMPRRSTATRLTTTTAAQRCKGGLIWDPVKKRCVFKKSTGPNPMDFAEQPTWTAQGPSCRPGRELVCWGGQVKPGWCKCLPSRQSLAQPAQPTQARAMPRQMTMATATAQGAGTQTQLDRGYGPPTFYECATDDGRGGYICGNRCIPVGQPCTQPNRAMPYRRLFGN